MSISAMRRWRPTFARHFSRRLRRSVRSAPSIVPDCVHFEPDMLERILKPIAYTEQAAAVAARDASALAGSDSDYRDVVAKGASL